MSVIHLGSIATGEGHWMCPSHLMLIHGEKQESSTPADVGNIDGQERAVHESAHAVAARWFGVDVTSMSIIDDDPNDSAPGRTYIEWGQRPLNIRRRQKRAENATRVLFAGAEATHGHYAADSTEYRMGGLSSLDDYAMAAHCILSDIEACSSPDIDARRRRDAFNRYVDEGRAGAAAIVRATVEVRGQLASALLRNGRLGRDEINAIVDPLLPPR